MAKINIEFDPNEVRMIHSWATTVKTTMEKKMRSAEFRSWRPSEQALYRVNVDEVVQLLAKLDRTGVVS